MSTNGPITLIENPDAHQNLHREVEVVGFNIKIFQQQLNFEIAAAKGWATLADIVPVARRISTKVTLAVLNNLKQQGQVVPCCKGCSQCCYYLVPLSVPEAFSMRRQILAMDPARREFLANRWLETASIVIENHQQSAQQTLTFTESYIRQISHWYSQLKLPCPFLSENLCSVYQIRPSACREHIVTGSSNLCGTDTTRDLNVVNMPISILEAMTQLTAQLEQSQPEAVMLPVALPWTQINLERDKRTWPAIEIVEKFADILQNMSLQNHSELTPIHQPV
jgi:Fe-S-cluster containining protein